MNETPKVKCILVGDLGVGKTSIISRFVGDKFRHEPVTLGVEFRQKIITPKQLQFPVRILLHDTAGQEAFWSVTRQFYRKADWVFLVYDVTQRKSFEDVIEWKTEAFQSGKAKQSYMLVGNKVDLNAQREVSTAEGIDLAKELEADFFEVSAKDGYNIEQLFSEAAVIFLKKISVSLPQEGKLLTPPPIYNLNTAETLPMIKKKESSRKRKRKREGSPDSRSCAC